MSEMNYFGGILQVTGVYDTVSNRHLRSDSSLRPRGSSEVVISLSVAQLPRLQMRTVSPRPPPASFVGGSE